MKRQVVYPRALKYRTILLKTERVGHAVNMLVVPVFYILFC